jgi:hypothetical protein
VKKYKSLKGLSKASSYALLSPRVKMNHGSVVVLTSLTDLLRGKDKPWATGMRRIRDPFNALKWRLADLLGLDADVCDDGHVHVFRKL